MTKLRCPHGKDMDRERCAKCDAEWKARGGVPTSDLLKPREPVAALSPRAATAPTLDALTGELGPSDARLLTDEVKRDVVGMRAKLLRLYEGHAHVALGYSSWKTYWQAEFETSWRTGYREIETARAEGAIAKMAMKGPALRPSQARELAPLAHDPAAARAVVEEASKDGPATAAKIRREVKRRTGPAVHDGVVVGEREPLVIEDGDVVCFTRAEFDVVVAALRANQVDVALRLLDREPA